MMTSERTTSPAVVVRIPQQVRINVEPFCCRGKKPQQRYNGVPSTRPVAVRRAEEVCCTPSVN